MPIIAAVLVAVGLAFVARGILLTRPGSGPSRPAWLTVPSRRTVGLAALAIVPLALIAASQTSPNKVPDAVAAPERVDRVTEGDAARPEPKAQSPARGQPAPPTNAPAEPAVAAPSRPLAVPAAEPNERPAGDGKVTNVSRTEAQSEPTPAPKEEGRKKGKGDDEPSPTPAPTGEGGGDSDDEDD